MLKLENMKRYLEYIVLSGYVKDEKPLSLFLIGKPETGKSSLIMVMKNYPNTSYHNDMSFKGLIDFILPKIEHNEISHILIPDFINVLAHKKAADALMPQLNSLMEEGIKDLKFYGSDRTFSRHLNGGVITGITKEMFDKRIVFWRNIGFLSRMLFMTYGYSESTQIEIHKYIKNGGKPNLKIGTKLSIGRYKLNSIPIIISQDISNDIELLTKTIVTQTSSYLIWLDGDKRNIDLKKYGFRLHIQLRTLAKSIALYNKEKEVTKEHINELLSFSSFMNFNYNEL